MAEAVRNPSSPHPAAVDQASELRRVKSELQRAAEERDIQKSAAAYFSKLSGQSSSAPMSPLSKDDARVLSLIKQYRLKAAAYAATKRSP